MIKTQISAKPILHYSNFSAKNSSSNPQFLLFQLSKFTTFSHNDGGAFYPPTSYPSRRLEEESRNVRVSVWWDFENCHLPVGGASVFRVAPSITAAVRANGIKGPIQITAFGDVMQMSRQNQEALSSTGIHLNHIPRGGKNSADRSLLVDLMYWVSQNPPPAHLFLISGDRDFAGILHRLRMNNYNILLASSEYSPSVLCSAASIMWQWSALLKGEDLRGKHFNQPPDGPYGSWYGYYKGPLEDPFAVLERSVCPRAQGTDQSICLPAPAAEPSTCPQSEDLTDSVSENKAQSIPKLVVKQIRQILYEYPKGISITDLRAELSKSSLTVDKEFYGYKKFSKFLLAMPHILKLQSKNDGQFVVHGVTPKIPEQADPISGSTVIRAPLCKGEVDSTVPAKLNDERGFSSDQSKTKSSPPPSSGTLEKNAGKLRDSAITIQKSIGMAERLPFAEPKDESPSTNLQDPRVELRELPGEIHEPSEGVEAVGNAKATESQSHNIELSPISEVGFFKKISRKWFGKKDNGEDGINSNANHLLSEETKAGGKDVKPMSESVMSVGTDSSSNQNDDAVHAHDDGTSRINQPSDEKMKTQGSGSFRQFLRKFLWGSSAQPNGSGEFIEKTNKAKITSEINEIFGEKRFWDELKAFLDTPKASAIIKQSRTRIQMVQDLQKYGPQILSSLSEADLLHLAELIILDKKWIEESAAKSYPFKLVHTDEKASSSQLSNISRQSNGLSSMFSNTEPISLSQRLREIDRQKRHTADTQVSEPAVDRVPSHKSRSEILADCQRLVDEIVKKYPGGFNIKIFRKVFSERYGYSLDIQKLGYQSLATLLQIMPGVRIKSGYILPAASLAKSSSLSVGEIDDEGIESQSEKYLCDSFGKENDNDSQWEELGPVANSTSNKNGKIGPQKLDYVYESVSEDYLTDSEEETSSTKPERQDKIRSNEDESTLLQILESWYGPKDENRKRGGASENPGDAQSSTNGSRVSSSARSSVNFEAPTGARRLKPAKQYSFVQGPALENKDKLINGILGSMKKAEERSAETRL